MRIRMSKPSEGLLFAVEPFFPDKKLTEPFIFYRISEKENDTIMIEESDKKRKFQTILAKIKGSAPIIYELIAIIAGLLLLAFFIVLALSPIVPIFKDISYSLLTSLGMVILPRSSNSSIILIGIKNVGGKVCI